MSEPLSAEQLEHLYRKGRNDALSEALLTFGETVTAVSGFLLCNGFVIHQRISGSPIVCGEGTVVKREQLKHLPDPVVNHLELAIGQGHGAEPDPFRASLAIFAIRLGLLSRILDMAYVHLKDRVSFGQKTLSHQLVKSTFAEVHGAVVRLTEQMYLRADQSLTEGLFDDHGEVTEFNGKAEKLMGGHGYLLTGTHSLSYLSMLLFSIYGAARW